MKMGFLKLPIIILLIVLILILGLLLFFKTQFNKQQEGEPSSEIQIFRKASPPPLKTYEQLSEEEKMHNQALSDKYYSEIQDTILKTYPWYNYFPIKGQNYFVYFDLDQKGFFALLYPQKSSSVTIDNQVNNLKEIITDRLRNIDTKTLTLPIEWEIKPE